MVTGGVNPNAVGDENYCWTIDSRQFFRGYTAGGWRNLARSEMSTCTAGAIAIPMRDLFEFVPAMLCSRRSSRRRWVRPRMARFPDPALCWRCRDANTGWVRPEARWFSRGLAECPDLPGLWVHGQHH